MANTYLTKTQSSNGNLKTITYSLWLKRSGLGSENFIYIKPSGSDYPAFSIAFASDLIRFYDYSGSAFTFNFITTQVFRDTSAWYHIVLAIDTTQGIQANRVKLYVNGSQVTSFGTSVYPSQNSSFSALNTNKVNYISSYGSGAYFNGSMSHIHFIDGTAYDASYFGSTDSVTGEWKINTSPSVTYGTNGFFILKDGNSVTDQSGEGNDFTVGGGTLTKTEDSPSNVFATMNPLSSYYFGGTFSNGNTQIVSNNSNESYATSTLGVSSGKYYWEVKNLATQNYEFIGISDRPANATTFSAWTSSNCIGYYSRTGGYRKGSDGDFTYGNTYGQNDIIGVALDMDNSKLYFSKNGTWQNSGDPTSGATGTGAISLYAPVDNNYFAVAGDIHVSNSTFAFNFGNGYFGTTAVSTAGTNASGNGIFEHDVPTGYTALSTKGLNL